MASDNNNPSDLQNDTPKKPKRKKFLHENLSLSQSAEPLSTKERLQKKKLKFASPLSNKMTTSQPIQTNSKSNSKSNSNLNSPSTLPNSQPSAMNTPSNPAFHSSKLISSSQIQYFTKTNASALKKLQTKCDEMNKMNNMNNINKRWTAAAPEPPPLEPPGKKPKQRMNSTILKGLASSKAPTALSHATRIEKKEKSAKAQRKLDEIGELKGNETEKNEKNEQNEQNEQKDAEMYGSCQVNSELKTNAAEKNAKKEDASLSLMFSESKFDDDDDDGDDDDDDSKQNKEVKKDENLDNCSKLKANFKSTHDFAEHLQSKVCIQTAELKEPPLDAFNSFLHFDSSLKVLLNHLQMQNCPTWKGFIDLDKLSALTKLKKEISPLTIQSQSQNRIRKFLNSSAVFDNKCLDFQEKNEENLIELEQHLNFEFRNEATHHGFHESKNEIDNEENTIIINDDDDDKNDDENDYDHEDTVPSLNPYQIQFLEFKTLLNDKKALMNEIAMGFSGNDIKYFLLFV